jgi:hypothetical protein
LAVATGCVAWCEPARAVPIAPQLVEADLSVAFGEGLGRAPLVLASAGLELGAGGMVGLAAYGGALVTVPEALGFLESTEVGGGLTGAVRVYLRGHWPAGFAVGVAASVAVVAGVATMLPRVEVTYRWVVLGGLGLRVQGLAGGAFIVDTQAGDTRPGPEEGELSGFLIGFGVAIGWSLAGV